MSSPTRWPAADLVGPRRRRARQARRGGALGDRGPVKRLLAGLAAAMQRGAGLSIDELFECGWPGESATGQAAVNRVHNGLATLRKLGLRDTMVRDEGRYRLVSAQLAWRELI